MTLGTVEPRKNLETILTAVDKLPPDVGLVVIGGPRSESDAKTVQQRRPNTKFLGYVPDERLPQVFACAAAFISASHAEGFGLPVLEAMRLGTPVVCSEIPAHKEVAGQSALYFFPNDSHGACNALMDLLDNHELASVLRVQGMERASEFTWSRTAGLTVQAFEGAG